MDLSERETAALSALASVDEAVTGFRLAALMRRAGRQTTTAAAHQAGVALARKGLASKGTPPGSDFVRYEITNDGRARAAAP